MHQETLEKIIRLARRSPRALFNPGYFAKICTSLDIEVLRDGDFMIFSAGGRTARTPIITAKNCARFKCVVAEGKSGIMLYEFINILVRLLTGREVPPSPFDKLGPTADFYCQQGTDWLEEKLLQNPL